MKRLIGCAAVALVAMTFALVPVAIVVEGCSPAVMQEEAKDAYLAQQMDCVKNFETRAEIDACRERVRDAWGIGGDAGKDGAQ